MGWLAWPSEISTVVLAGRVTFLTEPVPASYPGNYKEGEFSLFLAESAQHQSIHYQI